MGRGTGSSIPLGSLLFAPAAASRIDVRVTALFAAAATGAFSFFGTGIGSSSSSLDQSCRRDKFPFPRLMFTFPLATPGNRGGRPPSTSESDFSDCRRSSLATLRECDSRPRVAVVIVLGLLGLLGLLEAVAASSKARRRAFSPPSARKRAFSTSSVRKLTTSTSNVRK
jgi:hypothetical protein